MNGKPVLPQTVALSAYLIFTPLISLAISLFLPLPAIAIALLMLLIPSTLAVLLTGLTEGRKGVGELLQKLLKWRIHLKWYAIALGLPFGIIVASRVLAVLLGWARAVEFSIPERSMLIINSVFIPLVAILEELGWRGYALPRLLVRRSPLKSALIIGVAHGILHLGLGLVAGRPRHF
jgi:membrane protease YdiL (CAAX protease family)